MLISFRHRFLFVHVFRTGGTSITQALKPFAHDPTVPPNTMVAQARKLLRIKPPAYLTTQFPDHVTVAELQRQIPPVIFRPLFKFAFVRNPWDWQVSLYTYMRSTPEHHQYALVRAMAGFDDYLLWRVSNPYDLQKDFLVDAAGNLLVDFVGKFERLREDYATVCRKINIQAPLPCLNRSKHDDYRAYYNPTTRDLIARHFREDIERFGYTFEG